MTAVQSISVMSLCLTSSACDRLMDSIVANKDQNPALNCIWIFGTGADDKIERNEKGYGKNVNFSEAAKTQVAALKAKYVQVEGCRY